VVESLGLEHVVDAVSLVTLVAHVVTEPRNLDLGNHDLAYVAAGTHHGRPLVRHPETLALW